MSKPNLMPGTDASARYISRYVHLQRESAGIDSVSRFTLDPGQGEDTQLSARFARETALLSAARHPHLPRAVADAGDGARIGEALMVFAPSDTGWLATVSLHRRVLMFAQLASAVGALHRSGLVHGVLHPDRCGVRASGELVLLDLGMAWRGDAGRGGGDDLSYSAPECRTGRSADVRADLYSLGLLLYYFLSAAAPPRRGAVTLADEFAALQPLLETLLSATPSQRPGSVTMLLDRLNATIMRSPGLADRIEGERRPDETPVERAIAVLSMQSQNAAFTRPVGVTAESGGTRWQASARRSPAGAAFRIGVALAVVAAAVAYGIRSRAPAELGLVESLARSAQTQIQSGRLLLPADDNALDTLRTLRGVDPDAAATAELGARIRAEAPAAVERAIAAQALDDADAALSRALRAFPDDAALAALSNRMATARAEAAEREQRRALLQRIDALFAGVADDEEKLAELYASVQGAQAIAPGDADVAERRGRVEALLAERVRAALARDDLPAAKTAVERVREWFPGSLVLAGLDADYRQRAGVSLQQQLDDLLRDGAAAERGDLTRPDAVAQMLDRYLAAARLVPGDAAAEGGVVRAGRIAHRRAADAVTAGDWEAARRWLALARRALPAAEIADLAGRIEQQRREDSAAREERIARAELALRRGQYFGADGAMALYRAVGGASSPQRRDGIERVRRSALEDTDALIAQRRYDDAALLVSAALENFGKDAEFGRRRRTLASLQARPAGSTAASAQGTLAINAIPWANVESVTSVGDGRAVAIDGDATTPLRLSLPAGEYRIVLRDPSGTGTSQVGATVKAGDSVSVAVNLRDTPPAAADAVRSKP